MLRAEMRALDVVLASQRPAVVCCSTYPLYAFMLERLAARPAGCAVLQRRHRLHHHQLTLDPPGFAMAGFVPNEETASHARHGRATGQAARSGFPVPAFFNEHAGDLAPPDLAAGAVPRVLYIIHSGVRHGWETARRLLAETGMGAHFRVGRDERLRRRLARWPPAGRGRRRFLGWTNEVPRLLMTHHIVISKAGGATTQEAIAARCPMLVNQIVPGTGGGQL